MSEDNRKNQNKGKNDAKEQRKPRQSRNQHSDQISEKKVERKSETPKVPAPKPVYEDPGPEFYKSLKRETDEILKITEEVNAKYKKKEIQSNWTKYEMPIESYDEINEQQNLGADYEQLIQAPTSLGGHFQFKHEKNWDIATGPSLYDKYFEINMDNLAVALSTIPFYERNAMEKSIFTKTDIVNMENRSVKYKRKYYNDKSYTTSELQAADSIIANIKDDHNIQLEPPININSSSLIEDNAGNVFESSNDFVHIEAKETAENKPVLFQENVRSEDVILNSMKTLETVKKLQTEDTTQEIDDFDDLLIGTVRGSITSTLEKTKDSNVRVPVQVTNEAPITQTYKETKPIVESPEDLEKWLDDFLDG